MMYALIMLLSIFVIMIAGSIDMLTRYGTNAVTVFRMILFFLMAWALIKIIEVLSE